MTNKTQKAIFLDRDGTIIRDKNYLARVQDIEYYPDTHGALKIMLDKGYRLYMVTNQSGVGRGYFSLDLVHEIHKAIDEDMIKNGLKAFAAWGICPHSPDDNCLCRKPSPKLIVDYIKKDKLDPSLCWMVGDKIIDAECGVNAGIKGVIVREEKHQENKVHPYFKTLLQFAETLE
jgi:D-glycero-D-manno-heptose 1,7-bisphosphate phosphatase